MKILGKILFWVPSLLLVFSGIMKVYMSTQPADKLPEPTMAGKLIPLAIIELVVVSLYMITKTRNIGFLLVCSYMGGAIATGFMGANPTEALGPAAILAIFWVGKFLNDKSFFLPNA